MALQLYGTFSRKNSCLPPGPPIQAAVVQIKFQKRHNMIPASIPDLNPYIILTEDCYKRLQLQIPNNPSSYIEKSTTSDETIQITSQDAVSMNSFVPSQLP
jgi:hypothetical protein